MTHIFKEKTLSQDFCQKKIAEAKRLINLSIPFTVVGMPSSGISFFLRFLAVQDFAYFVHIDINELSKLSKSELLKVILKKLPGRRKAKEDPMENIRKKLSVLTQKHERVVLLFNRFDRLQKEFDQNFFANLRTLWEVDKEKIVLIFTANKPLIEIAPEAVSGGNLNLCSKVVYLKPYSDSDLTQVVKMNSPNLLNNEKKVKTAINLSGGHYQLFVLLLKSDHLFDNPIDDPAVAFQLKDLAIFLDKRQQTQLHRIALGKRLTQVDRFLVNVGYLKPTNRGFQVFSVLLQKYLLSTLALKLPKKEQQLFILLKMKRGKIVSKQEIFEKVWGNEEATDWALDSLIYRLRKNPALVTKGYIIESQKRSGYCLSKI